MDWKYVPGWQIKVLGNHGCHVLHSRGEKSLGLSSPHSLKASICDDVGIISIQYMIHNMYRLWGTCAANPDNDFIQENLTYFHQSLITHNQITTARLCSRRAPDVLTLYCFYLKQLLSFLLIYFVLAFDSMSWVLWGHTYGPKSLPRHKRTETFLDASRLFDTLIISPIKKPECEEFRPRAFHVPTPSETFPLPCQNYDLSSVCTLVSVPTKDGPASPGVTTETLTFSLPLRPRRWWQRVVFLMVTLSHWWMQNRCRDTLREEEWERVKRGDLVSQQGVGSIKENSQTAPLPLLTRLSTLTKAQSCMCAQAEPSKIYSTKWLLRESDLHLLGATAAMFVFESSAQIQRL